MLEAITAEIRDHGVVAGRKRAQFDLIGLRRRIVRREHSQRPLVQSEAHVQRGKIQHANCVIGKLFEVRLSELFAEKIAQRKKCDSLPRQRLPFLHLTGRDSYRNQLLDCTHVVRCGSNSLSEMTLGLIQIAVPRQHLSKPQGSGGAKGGKSLGVLV